MRKVNLEKHWNYRRNCFENILDLDIDWQEAFIDFMFIVISFAWIFCFTCPKLYLHQVSACVNVVLILRW